MLTTKNYYGNPNLIKKVRIRTTAANQNEEFNKTVQNLFTNEKEVNNYISYNEINNTANTGTQNAW